MLLRKVMRLVRGKATPVQVALAAVLGSMIGFVPGFAEGAGLLIALTLLLVMLNANLLLAALCGLLAKTLSFLLLPVSFQVGRVLLDGPAQGLFKWAINAPVLAWFGFHRYLTTGSLLVGLVVGLALAWLLVAAQRRIRMTMKAVEEKSPRYTALMRTWWARALLFVLVGRGHGKKTYEELLAKRVGNPIRVLGVVLAVLVVALGAVLYQFTRGPIVTALLHGALERANGATVDLQEVQVALAEGRITILGLAMADPNALATDLLRAERVEANLSGADLLRKRFAVDRIELTGAAQGAPRKIPGRLVGDPPRPLPAPPDTVPPESRPLEDYLRQARLWKERLAQIRAWLDRLSSLVADDEPDPDRGAVAAERARRRGYASVIAKHLVEGAPALTIYELLADKVTTPHLPAGETLTIRGENISTNPRLLGRPARVTIESSGGTLLASAGLEAGGGALALRYRGLPAERATGGLRFAGKPPFAGGTVDLEATGGWKTGAPIVIDFPLKATLNDTTLTIGSSKPTRVAKLVVPIGVRGPIDDPRITLDDDTLARSLRDAGVGELATRLEQEAGKALDKAIKDLPPEAGDALKQIGEGLLKKKKEGG